MIQFEAGTTTTLLLVDDNPEILDGLSVVLKSSGFSVLTAGSPDDALTMILQPAVHDVDVAILDYHMPGMNGCVLADHVRARYPDLKIILYSGALDIPEREMSRVDGFVPKGGGVEPLLRQISKLREVSQQRAIAHSKPHCNEACA